MNGRQSHVAIVPDPHVFCTDWYMQPVPTPDPVCPACGLPGDPWACPWCLPEREV